MQFKRCLDCKRTRPVVAFYKRTGSRDGLQSYCIECSNARRRMRLSRVLLCEATDAPNSRWKRCGGCAAARRLEDYHLKATTKDGLQEWCKDCTRAAVRASYRRRKIRLVGMESLAR